MSHVILVTGTQTLCSKKVRGSALDQELQYTNGVAHQPPSPTLLGHPPPPASLSHLLLLSPPFHHESFRAPARSGWPCKKTPWTSTFSPSTRSLLVPPRLPCAPLLVLVLARTSLVPRVCQQSMPGMSDKPPCALLFCLRGPLRLWDLLKDHAAWPPARGAVSKHLRPEASWEA